MMQRDLVSFTHGDFPFSDRQVLAITQLVEEGATVPFMARYRKERTGGLDEVAIQKIVDTLNAFKEFEQRKTYILNTIEEQGQLDDRLKQQIMDCLDPSVLEDLYLPYKKRKATKADRAIKWGLEGLAKIIMAQREHHIERAAQTFVKGEVKSVDIAIEGAQWIIADWINQDVRLREKLRQQFIEHGVITSKVKPKEKEKGQKFKDFFQHEEKVKRCPSYRLLAMFRGEQEGILSLKIRPDEERALRHVYGRRIKSQGRLAQIIEEACQDAYQRLLAPSMETQTRQFYKEKADEQAITVFAQNVEQLLMAPPLGEKTVLAIDPGFRTGCKVVVLSPQGELLNDTVIYPHPPQNQKAQAFETIQSWCLKYNVEAIAVGDATAGRETWEWLEPSKDHLPAIHLVDESGASIYSASEIGREEFPDHDATVRGAVSIGRRLMDPLAELIKIDPKSIGVGEYQHDVNQSLLQKKLDEVIEVVVNRVGVQLNTCSPSLLTHVSGLGKSLAQNIVDYRNEYGPFTNLKELKKVPRLGNKAFEQSSGFLRIREGDNPLDNTGVHPESYAIVGKMAKSLGKPINDLIGRKDLLGSIKPQSFVTPEAGLPTIQDILKELSKPGLDIRGEIEAVSFDQKVRSINDLHEGMLLHGTIKNITGFGAFVDLGIKQNGLVHISQLVDRYIEHPSEAVHLRQKVRVKVIGLDLERERIQLSMKDLH